MKNLHSFLGFLMSMLLLAGPVVQASQIVYIGDENLEIKSPSLILDSDNTDTDLTLQFGSTLNETLSWDNANTMFVFTDDLLVQGNITVGSSTETIDSDGGAFSLSGDDIFVADSLGVEGAIYTDSTATKFFGLDIFGCIRGSAGTGTVAGGRSAVVRFDATNNSQMRCSLPVPDDWQTGTDVTATIFWSPSDNTTGDVDFDFDYASFALGDTIATGSFTDAIATVETVAVNTQLDVYQLTVTIPAAALGTGEMVNFRFNRDPTVGADTYAADVNIHLIRIDYTGKKLL